MHDMSAICTNIKVFTMSRTELWLLLIIAALALYILYFHLNASITRVKNKSRSSRTRISNKFDFHGKQTQDTMTNIRL